MGRLVAAGWLVVSAWTGFARAEEVRPAGVLVLGPPASPVVERLEDELAAAGWEVRTIPTDRVPADETLVRMIRMRRAVAAVVATSPAEAIRIRILAEAGAPEERTLAVPDGDVEEVVRLVAVQVVEALRATLQAAQGAPEQSPSVEVVAAPDESAAALPGESAATPPDEFAAAPPDELAAPSLPEPTARWWITAGPGFAWSPGGVDAFATFDVALRWHAWEYVTVAAGFAAPLGTPVVAAAEGSAEVQPWRAYLDLRWLPLAGRGWFQPDLGLGLGAAFVRMTGTAEPGFVGTDDLVSTFAASLVAGLEYRALDWLALRLDAWVGSTLPGVGVRFADRRVAEWGRPLLGVTLAAAAGW